MRDHPPISDALTTTAVEVFHRHRQLTATTSLCRLAAFLSLSLCFFSALQSGDSSFSAHAQIPTALPFERELAGGEMHTYRLNLSSGQFIRAAFDQRGIDVEVTLLDASGSELMRVNNPVGVWGPEPVFFEVERGGQYTLVVRPFKPTAPVP